MKIYIPLGRDPRAVDTRGPISGQRVPVAGGMQGPPPHGMGQTAPPTARPVRFKKKKAVFWNKSMFAHPVLSLLQGPTSDVSSQDHEKVSTSVFFYTIG